MCYSTHSKSKFLFWSHQCLVSSNLVLIYECLRQNWQNSVTTFNVKLTQKAKVLTKFCQLLPSYLIRRKCLKIYFPTTKYPYEFPDHLSHLFFTVLFAIFHVAVSIQLYYRLYQSPSHSPPHQNLGSYFFSFRKMWVNPYHLYCQ